MKPRKAILKRFRITKNGKILRRQIGQDHCLAKKTGKRRRQGRKWVQVARVDVKKIRRLLH